VIEDNLRQLYSTQGLLKALNSFSSAAAPEPVSAASESGKLVAVPEHPTGTAQVWTKFQANVCLDKIRMKLMSRDAKGNCSPPPPTPCVHSLTSELFIIWIVSTLLCR
jgi:hypothetical protein